MEDEIGRSGKMRKIALDDPDLVQWKAKQRLAARNKSVNSDRRYVRVPFQILNVCVYGCCDRFGLRRDSPAHGTFSFLQGDGMFDFHGDLHDPRKEIPELSLRTANFLNRRQIITALSLFPAANASGICLPV